jgi:hypothetical protein
MKVTVKQIDINRGEQGDVAQCPLARARRRALGDKHAVEVGIGTWDIDDEQAFSLPKRAVEFVSDFDLFGPQAVEPFSFVTRKPA